MFEDHIQVLDIQVLDIQVLDIQVLDIQVLGFTGTQRGLTKCHCEQIAGALGQLSPKEVHYGDWIGADAQFHALVRELLPGTRIVIHPPRVLTKGAFCQGDEERAPRAYLTRNRAIVRQSEMLLAAPGEALEKLRSGTWATIRFARKNSCPVHLVLPTPG